MDNPRNGGVLVAPVERHRPLVASDGRALPVAASPILAWRLSMLATRELVGVLAFVVMSTVLCPWTWARSRQAQAEESHG